MDLILPLPTTGHPPAFLIPFFLFWLSNLVLLPAAAIALRMSYREHEERALPGDNFLLRCDEFSNLNNLSNYFCLR